MNTIEEAVNASLFQLAQLDWIEFDSESLDYAFKTATKNFEFVLYINKDTYHKEMSLGQDLIREKNNTLCITSKIIDVHKCVPLCYLEICYIIAFIKTNKIDKSKNESFIKTFLADMKEIK